MAAKHPKKIISNFDFSTDKSQEDFEQIEFVNCIFTDLSNLNFTDCDFKNCNLSNLKVKNARIQQVKFSDCKLLGINFSEAKDFAFELHFENCNLDYTSFDRKKLNKSSFKNSRLHYANFSQADLSKCKIENCDLLEALFSGTNMSTVDFTTNLNFLIDPEQNTIKKAKFLTQQLPSLLYRHDIIVE